MSVVSKSTLFRDIMLYLCKSSGMIRNESLIEYMVDTKEWNSAEAKLLINAQLNSSIIYEKSPEYYALI